MNKQTIKHTNVIKKLTGTIVKKVARYEVVYRLEHKEYGIGPFRDIELYENPTFEKFIAMCGTWEWYCNHPTPENEGIDYDLVARCICACKDIEQLKSWFGEYLKWFIERQNFQLVRYYVRITGVHFTQTQALIEPEKVIKKVVVKNTTVLY